jgi:probable O-glycosylation ligase (exosortase A-associated)
MRGYAFLLVYLWALTLIFKSPFNGVLVWYTFSLGNFHTLIWNPALSTLNYAYPIAILTCVSWLFSRGEKKKLPLTPQVILTMLFALWITITSFFALVSPDTVWDKWNWVEKMLFMCLVGFALTTTRERVNQLIWVVVLSIGFWGVKGAISFPLHGGGAGIHGPDGGITAGNNEFGVALVMILPLVFYMWHTVVDRRLRNGLMIMGFLLSLATVFTYSRGALLGVCAMATVLWLRTPAKLSIGLAILFSGLAIYVFAPHSWFTRMDTIETYQSDGSAMERIAIWRASLRIAELHPIMGGGFNITHDMNITNRMLEGTTLTRLTKGRAAHSIYFDVLSEHGWVGLALFVMIAFYALLSCSWLIRNSRDRPDLAWANMLGRMGQAVLAGFCTAGAFQSLAYFDEYWCIVFIFEAARRVVAIEITAPANRLAVAPSRRLLLPQPAVGGAARLDERVGFVRDRA